MMESIGNQNRSRESYISNQDTLTKTNSKFL